MIKLEQAIGVVQLASDPTTTSIITDIEMTVPGPGIITPLPLLALLTLTSFNHGILADHFLRHETDTTTLPSLLGTVQSAMSKVGKPSLCTAVIYLSKIKPKMPDNVIQPTIYIDAESYDESGGAIDDHEEVQTTSSNCHDIILVSLSLSRIESFLEDHKLDLKGSPPGKFVFVLLTPVKVEEGSPTTVDDIRQSLVKPKGFVARLNHLLVMSQNPDLDVFGAYVRVYPAPGLTNITLKDRWIKNKGFQFGGNGLFQEKVPNILNGRKLDIVIARKYFKPVSYKTGRIRPEGFEEYAGYEPELIDVLASSLNFTYVQFDPSDGEWEGSIYESGNSSGALREVALELADMGASNFLMKLPHKLVDFLYPHQIDYTCFLVQRPTKAMQAWASLVDPYEPIVWLLTVLSVAVSVLISVIFVELGSCDSALKAVSSELVSSSEAFMFLASILMSESHSLTFKITKESTRLFYGILILGMFVLTSAYKGALISYLTDQRDPPAIDTIKDLAEKIDANGMILGGRTRWELDNVLMPSDNIYLKNMIKHYKAVGDFTRSRNMKGFQREEMIWMCRQTFFRFTWQERFLDGGGKSKVHMMSECAKMWFLSFTLQRNSQYNSIMTGKLHAMMEAGIVKHFIDREIEKATTWQKSTGFGSDSDGMPMQLEIGHLKGTFYLWLVGTMLGLVSFIVEMFPHVMKLARNTAKTTTPVYSIGVKPPAPDPKKPNKRPLMVDRYLKQPLY